MSATAFDCILSYLHDPKLQRLVKGCNRDGGALLKKLRALSGSKARSRFTMNRSGFASCSNPTTTPRSRFLRKMGQMGQLMHHLARMRRATWRLQACLPVLVLPRPRIFTAWTISATASMSTAYVMI